MGASSQGEPRGDVFQMTRLHPGAPGCWEPAHVFGLVEAVQEEGPSNVQAAAQCFIWKPSLTETPGSGLALGHRWLWEQQPQGLPGWPSSSCWLLGMGGDLCPPQQGFTGRQLCLGSHLPSRSRWLLGVEVSHWLELCSALLRVLSCCSFWGGFEPCSAAGSSQALGSQCTKVTHNNPGFYLE